MRNSIFISHSKPEDNEFASWLTSRLYLFGYRAWIDLEELPGGERDFWKPIENEIRDNAIKFLLVVSNSTFKKDGVLDEYEFARSIAKEKRLKDFIIPLRVTETPYTERIGQSRYNHIDFVDSWPTGLKLLIKKLEKDGVPRNAVGSENPIQHWYESRFSSQFEIVKKRELYYSNWWPIGELPDKLLLYQFQNETQAEAVLKGNHVFPVVRHGNVLATFDDSLKLVLSTDDGEFEIKPKRIYGIIAQQILNGFEADTFPTWNDSQNLLKRVLNRSFHLLMKKRGLFWHEISARANCYYFPTGKLPRNKVKFRYRNRHKIKNLLGKYSSGKWHFGVSVRTLLNPILCFSLRSHILFSNDGSKIWDDARRLHAARRKKGRKWFNEEWRDQLMAFLNALKSDDGKIRIHLNNEYTLDMPLLTKDFNAEFGYSEPTSKDRLTCLVSDEEFEHEVED